MKKFEPTAEQRRLVRKLSGLGCTQAEILDVVPWPNDRAPDLKTLRKHFRAEIDRGYSAMNTRLRGKLYEEALSGNTAALIFLSKARLGLRETQVIEQTGPNGAPLPPAATVTVFLPKKDERTFDPPVDLAAKPEPTTQRCLPTLEVRPVEHPKLPTNQAVPLFAATDESATVAVGRVGPLGAIFPGAADIRR